MADDNASQYRERWKTADRARLERWVNQPIAPVVETPAVPAPEPAAPQGMVGRVFSAGSAVTGKMEEAGGKALRDTFTEGATNFVKGLGVPKTVGDFSGFGQSTLGVLQMLSALPAGAGAAVQAALEHYVPGANDAVAIPGGAAGEKTVAGVVRSVLAAPSLVLDPKVREARRDQPQALAEELNKPITYGELLNLVTQFATGHGMSRRGGAAKAGKAAEPGVRTVTGEVVEPAPRPALEMPVVEGEVVRPPPAALGAGAPPRAIPERATPAAEPAIPLGESPLTMSPEQVAIHLRDTLAAIPRRETPSAAGAVAEAPKIEPASPLGGAMETALTKSEQILREELAKAEVDTGGVPTGAAAPESTAPPAGPPTVVAAGERGGADPALLARMALGAAAGGTQGDTPEERIMNALVGMGLGATLSKRMAIRLRDAYRESGLSDESGAIDFSKFRRPSAAAQEAVAEAEYQPNYARLSITSDVVAFSRRLHEQIKGQILEARGGVKTHDATVAAAQELITSGKMTPDRILTFGPEEVLSREQWTAARMVGAEAVVTLKGSKAAYDAGRMPAAEFENQFAVTTAIAQNVLAMRKRIAQSQEAGKIVVGPEGGVPYRPEDLIHLAAEHRGNADAISKGLGMAKTPRETAKVLETGAVFPRAFLEFMYFSYLSGKSALRNVVGNVLMMPDAVAVAAIAPYMPRGFPGVTKAEAWARPGVVPGTATQMAIGWGEGMMDSFRLLKLWDEPTRAELLAMPDQWGQRQIETRYLPAITAENFPGVVQAAEPLGLSVPLAAAIDYMGKGMRAVPEGMGVTDALSKMTNARMWQRAEAFRQASLEGLKDDAFMERVDALMNDWTLFDASARDRIMDFAHAQTLTKEFTSEWISRIAAGPENPWFNAFYRFSLVPFARTMLRGAEQTFLRTPGLNMLMSQFWRDMKMGGAEAQTAYARVAYGGMLMTLFGYLESRGDITGDEPDDPRMKQLWKQNGYKGRTFAVPGTETRFSYDNLGPITDLIRFGANMSMALRRGATDGLHAFLTGALTIATTFDTRSYTRTIQEFFDMMRGGQSGDKDEAVWEWLRKKGSVLVPAAVREIESGWDPAQRTVRPGDKSILDEMKTYMRDVMTKVPGFSSATDADGHPIAPPDLNVFTGEEIIGETWPFSPFIASTPKYHPVIDEVGRLRGAGLQMLPPNFLGGAVPKDQGGSTLEAPPVEENVIGGVRLKSWQRYRYTKAMTQEVRNDDGQLYMEALTRAIESDDYKAQSDIGPSGTLRDGGKATFLQRIEKDFMRRAEAAVHEEFPEIPKEIERRRGERAVRKTPTAEQSGVRQLIQSLGR